MYVCMYIVTLLYKRIQLTLSSNKEEFTLGSTKGAT